jgi:hypothetical protein
MSISELILIALIVIVVIAGKRTEWWVPIIARWSRSDWIRAVTAVVLGLTALFLLAWRHHHP